jgi:PKD domain
MRNNIIYLSLLLVLVLGESSCKKDDTGGGTKAVFSYVADGYKVNFTNFSTNATAYSWDFGDQSGITSTSKAPQHIFTKKGDFLVTLTATNGTESSEFKDTVSIIGPNIKIDGDLTDWQYVDYTYVNPAGYPGSLLAVKTFASSNLINFYLEGTADMKIELFDMYLDADNDPATGFSTFLYPAGSGADYLCEGSPLGFGDVFKHSGPPSGFTFSPVASFAEAMQFSTIQTVAGKKVIEFSIKKSALGTIKNFVNFCFVELTSGYADVGKIPEAQTPASKFIAIPL